MHTWMLWVIQPFASLRWPAAATSKLDSQLFLMRSTFQDRSRYRSMFARRGMNLSAVEFVHVLPPVALQFPTSKCAGNDTHQRHVDVQYFDCFLSKPPRCSHLS